MMSTAAQIDVPDEVWTRLESSPEWANLTGPQKVFVTVYCVTGNAVEATRAGYNPKSEQNCRVMSYELFANPRIAAALAVASGKPVVVPEKSDARLRRQLHRERKLLLHEICEQLLVAEPGSIAAQRLLSQKASVIQAIADSLEPEMIGAKTTSRPQVKVGDIVIVDGEKRRVLEIDENSRPTDVGDEVIE